MLNYEYPPIGGGAANFSKNILNEFAKMREIELDLVTTSPNKFIIDEISRNVRVHRLELHKKSLYNWTDKELITYSLKAYKYIKKIIKDFEVIHSISGVPCGIIAFLLRNEVPYIVSLRGSDVPGFSKSYSLHHYLLKPIIRKVWSNADLILANSVQLAKLAHKTSPDIPIDIIPNGVDINKFYPIKKTKKEKIRIICVSRLIERKGIDDLIRVVQLIMKDLNNFEVLIAGEGKLGKKLKKLSSELGTTSKVKFLGFIRNEDLPSLYQSSDIFVLPSKKEGMSNSMLEAMASGLPIITTDVGGIEELIKENGIVIPQGRIDVLADALTELILNPEKRRRMGIESREISSKMSWGNVAKRYYKIYMRTCNTKCI